MLQRASWPVAERGIIPIEKARFINQVDGGPDGTGIAGVINRYGQGVPMTKEKWLLLGALIVGLLVVLYFVFLCPSDCH